MHDVTVLYDVFFAFYAHFASFFDCGFGAVREEVFVFDNFGTDEALFEVGVDYAGALWSFPAVVECPSANLLYACGEVGFEAEECVS